MPWPSIFFWVIPGGYPTRYATFGYKNERYLRFGWASARLDDVANFIPARLSLLFMSIGAVLTGNLPGKAFAVGLRDARKHASPALFLKKYKKG